MKTIGRLVAPLAILLLLPSFAKAENPPAPGAPATLPRPEARSPHGPLELEEVLKSVDRAFPLIAAAAREQDEARAQLLSSEGGFDPSLKGSGTVEPISGYPKQYFTVQAEQPTALWGSTFFAGYRYGSGKIPIYEGKLETNEYGEVRGGVRVPILRDGAIDRRRASLRQAELGAQLAKLGVDQQRIESRRLAALRYWDWVAAGRRLAVLRAWHDLAVGRDEGIATRAERGDIPDIDRTENRRTILQRQTAVIGAERDLIQTSMELSLFLRDENGEPVSPNPNRLPQSVPDAHALDLPSPKAEEERALARRPDLKRFDALRDRSLIEADYASNQALPALDATVYGARQFGDGDPARGQTVVAGAVVLDIPILNRVQTGRARAAEAAVARTEAQRRYARDRVVADVRTALATIEASRDRAHVAKRELEVATQLAQAELRRFELGEGTMLVVNQREQGTAEAAIREIDALAEYHRATASYRAATAKDLR